MKKSVTQRLEFAQAVLNGIFAIENRPETASTTAEEFSRIRRILKDLEAILNPE